MTMCQAGGEKLLVHGWRVDRRPSASPTSLPPLTGTATPRPTCAAGSPALGGRAAEEIIYGDVTTGAENDMEHASGIARQMVGRWGMSPAIGPVSVIPS